MHTIIAAVPKSLASTTKPASIKATIKANKLGASLLTPSFFISKNVAIHAIITTLTISLGCRLNEPRLIQPLESFISGP